MLDHKLNVKKVASMLHVTPTCVYRWLKAPPAELPVFVGHGRDDRFAGGMQAIAERFPANARQCVAGDHDWPAWRDLWEHFLDRRLFNA